MKLLPREALNMPIRAEMLRIGAVGMIFALTAAAASPSQAGGTSTTITARSHRPSYAQSTKVCFWKFNNGTPFGVSGQCPVGPGASVGTPCTCTRTVEHNVTSHAGTVIEIPAGGTSSPVH